MSNTGIKSVYWHKRFGKYFVNIQRQGKQVAGQYFESLSEAETYANYIRSQFDNIEEQKPKEWKTFDIKPREYSEDHPASTGVVFIPSPRTDQVIKTVTDENGAVLYSITTNGNQLRERN